MRLWRKFEVELAIFEIHYRVRRAVVVIPQQVHFKTYFQMMKQLGCWNQTSVVCGCVLYGDVQLAWVQPNKPNDSIKIVFALVPVLCTLLTCTSQQCISVSTSRYRRWLILGAGQEIQRESCWRRIRFERSLQGMWVYRFLNRILSLQIVDGRCSRYT